MKIYISQPYAYKSDEEIVKVRNDIIKELHAYMKDIEILDSVIQKEQTFGLKQLSESILVLSDADAIIFAPGWEESRGCRIEHQHVLLFSFNKKRLPKQWRKAARTQCL